MVVIYKVESFAMQHWGGCGPPSEAGLARREALAPLQVAIKIEGEDPEVPETAVDLLPVGDRSFGGIAIFEVDRRLRFPFVYLPLP